MDTLNKLQWQFEEDDTVVTFHKNNGLCVGLVSEVFTDTADESSSDEKSLDDRLKPGQVRVEWYPCGKETVLTADRALVVDRALLMGEIVYRASQPNRYGIIRNGSVHADFAILPDCQYVVRNIKDERINFINAYDDVAFSLSVYIIYENWVGTLEKSGNRLLLKSDKGYQCWASTLELENELYDCCVKRVKRSSFNTKQWYVGEPVKCKLKKLDNVEWLPGRNPPETIMRKIQCMSNITMKFTVMKVETDFLNVHWIAAISGSNANMPSPVLKGEQLSKVKKLAHFEHQVTQLSDRIHIDIQPDDCILSFTDYRNVISNEYMPAFEAQVNAMKADKTSKRNDTSHSASNTASSVDFAKGDEKSCKSSTLVSSEEVAEPVSDDLWSDEETAPDKDVSFTVEREGSVKMGRRLGIMAQRGRQTTSRNISSKKRTNRRTIRKGKAAAPSTEPTHPKPQVGQTLPGEAILVKSYLDVMWQDGELELGVPSTELAYASNDLDDHLYVPGNFVSLQEEKDKLWPKCGYGVVEKVDNENRVATVTWFDLSEENDESPLDAKLIRKEAVSVFELTHHQDYEYPPSVLAIDVGNRDNKDQLPIGQVLYTDTNGEILLKLVDGTVARVPPQRLCRAVENEQFDESLSDSASQYEAGWSSDSWSTVSDSGSDALLDDDDDDYDDLGLFSDVEGKQLRDELVQPLTNLCGYFERLRSRLLILRKAEMEIDARYDIALLLVDVHATLKWTVRHGLGLSLKDHRYGKDFGNCIYLLNTWLKSVQEKDKRSGSVETHNHPAKDLTAAAAATAGVSPVSVTSRLESELNKLSQIEKKVEKLDSSSLVVKSDSASECGWVGSVKKLLSALLRQLLHETGVNLSAIGNRFLNVRRTSADQNELQRMAQDLLQRELERMVTERDESQSASSIEFFSSAFRSILASGPLQCVGHNPKQPGAMAVVDLSAFAATLIGRSIIEQLVTMCKTDCCAWTDSPSAPATDDEKHATTTDETKPPAEASTSAPAPAPTPATAILDNDTKQLEEIPPSSVSVSEKSHEEPHSSDVPEYCFQLLDKAPACHMFLKEEFDQSSVSSRFLKAVRQDIKLLRSSLPPGVYVKAYEDRMDLYACMLVGPQGTPFADGLFFFDIHLKSSYPLDPPVFHYKAYSTDQINPNLYQDGKVCVSLLGTWNGKSSEMWTVGSNLLQVFVSIQGLILNAEPYFNEAGYETRRALPDSLLKSRRYNEMSIIGTLEALSKIAADPPEGFEQDVRKHLTEKGQNLLANIEHLISGGACDFPLQPVSQGFALSAKKQLSKLARALDNLKF